MKKIAKKVLDIEIKELKKLYKRINDDFIRAVEMINDIDGSVVVTGMGKSGLIGKKISATLASTGTPAFFVHPAEASHGDLGMIRREDVLLALSNSGETEEVLRLLPVIKRLGVTLIAMTGRPGSTLAEHADLHSDTSVDQ